MMSKVNGHKAIVFVGLSGGVDSSVAAALLKREGYAVTGVFIKIWSPEWLWCTSKDDRLDAMRVCARLNIPFREIDLTDAYKKEVVDYMIREYRAGRTPNPDVVCNQKIKFGKFFDWAISEGADFVATGHYARVAISVERLAFSRNRGTGHFPTANRYTLHASSDRQKDQSYFLWTLTQRELSRTLFPIGHLTKPEVRKLAKKFGLPTADKKDSQGLCFVGPIDIKEFLSRYITPRRGSVLNEKGDVIGYHNGAFFLTVGERRAFTVSQKTSREPRYYVVAKNIKKNTVTVSSTPPSEKRFLVREVVLSHANWISGDAPSSDAEYRARFRYRQELERGRLVSPALRFRFNRPQGAIAAGQSLVIYRGDVCLGGGVVRVCRGISREASQGT